MMMKVAFQMIILSFAHSAMGQPQGARISPTQNPLGQAGGTLNINKENIAPSSQEVRHLPLSLSTFESDNVFKSFAKSFLPATGGGQKSCRRKKHGRNKEERLAIRLKILKRRERKQKRLKKQQRLRYVTPSSAPSETSMSPSNEPSASASFSSALSKESLAPVLEGEWVAISAIFDRNEVTVVKCITLTFNSSDKGGPLALGFAGCNYYVGGFEATPGLDDGSISFKTLSWTRMGCRDGSMEPERIYRQCLEAATSYKIEDKSLKISGSNGCVWMFRQQNSGDVDCP